MWRGEEGIGGTKIEGKVVDWEILCEEEEEEGAKCSKLKGLS